MTDQVPEIPFSKLVPPSYAPPPPFTEEIQGAIAEYDSNTRPNWWLDFYVVAYNFCPMEDGTMTASCQGFRRTGTYNDQYYIGWLEIIDSFQVTNPAGNPIVDPTNDQILGAARRALNVAASRVAMADARSAIQAADPDAFS